MCPPRKMGRRLSERLWRNGFSGAKSMPSVDSERSNSGLLDKSYLRRKNRKRL
jgi:hypothetical protein